MATLAIAVGAAMTAAALVPVPAQAAAQQATAACSMTLGTVTVQGDHKFQTITATSPVKAGTPSVGPKALFPVDQVRLASSVGWEPDPPSGMAKSGYVRIVNDLYRFRYVTDMSTGQLDPESYEKTKVGGGWVHQRNAYLYAVSHANGTATVIKGLGKVGNQLVAPEDKTYFRYFPGSPESDVRLYGE